jgi:hypothetical protein
VSGSLYLFFAVDSSKTGAEFGIWYTKPDSTFTSWSNVTSIYPLIYAVSGVSFIDPFVDYFNGTYYLWYKDDTDRYVCYATCSTVDGGYTLAKTGDWNGWGHGNTTTGNHGYEAPCIVHLQGGGFLLYVDSSVRNGILFSASPDYVNWSPFQGPVVFNNPNADIMSGPDIRRLAIVTPPVRSPELRIQRSGTNVVLSWPWVPPAGFVLETTDVLASTNPWTAVSNLPAFRGAQYMATNQVWDGSRFYRLRR